MELRRHFDWRFLFVGLCVVLFGVYIVVGLQPARASDYEISGELEIPSIGLVADVTGVEMKERKLEVPDAIVGSYAKAENKTLLVGHSTTVFSDLDEVELKDEIIYNGKVYKVSGITWTTKERVRMNELLKREDEDTLVIMTCAGELLDGGAATHRLIITALAR